MPEYRLFNYESLGLPGRQAPRGRWWLGRDDLARVDTTSAAVASLRAWLHPSYSWGFTLERMAVWMITVLPPAYVLVKLGYDWVALVALLAIGAYSRSHWLKVSADGVEIGWWFMSMRVPFTRIAKVEVTKDPRRWVLGERGPVLVVERHDGPRILVFARPAELERLRAALARQVRLP